MAVTGKSVFPERVDHIYCLWVAGDSGAPGETYIGQSVTPGRALKHFHSHNSLLAGALHSGREWAITFQSLPVPNVEDLNILESAAIDVISDDHRLKSLNHSLGTSADKPRKFDPETQTVPKTSILMGWKVPDNGEPTLRKVKIAGKKPDLDEDLSWWATPPFSEKKNLKAARKALRALRDSANTTTADAASGVSIGKPYFTFITELTPELEAPETTAERLPGAGKTCTVEELWNALGGSFIYVQVNDETFDDCEDRRGLSPGLDLATLEQRVFKYWDKGSSSTTPGRTLRHLADPLSREELPDEARPTWLVGAASGSAMILCIWKLGDEEDEDWIDPATDKVIFPAEEPAGWDLLKHLMGVRISEDLVLRRKAVKWLDTPQLDD